jgi:hypothetical protein
LPPPYIPSIFSAYELYMSFVFSIMIVSFFIASVISSNWAKEDKAGGYLR